MMVLNDDVKKQVSKVFEELTGDVKIQLFTQKMECEYCADTHSLVEEISALTDKISVEVYDFVDDKAKADELGIDKIPAIAIGTADKDFGIRFYGVPAGYEFSSFLEGIKMVSAGKSALSQSAKDYLDELKEDVHLQVFVTPTCPHCPPAVVTAHQMAFYSDKVKADMVEVSEFPHIGNKYNVMGVPRTVINETEFQEGSAPDTAIIEKIKASLK